MKLFWTLLAITTAIYAQVDTGSVSGVVRDKTGAVIAGATLRVTQQGTGTELLTKSNDSGLYTAPSLRPGQYVIQVEKEGFRITRSQPFELRVQDRAEVNFDLELGSTSSEVTISATAALLESETSSLGQVIEEKTIRDLPLNGRNYIQLATLTAGTLPSTRTAERDNFISNGARAIQNSYLLDGIDNKNRIVGFDKSSAQIIQPIIDALQEFKVQTSTFSAEFGQAAGGVVNVTMKSGGNDYHGNVFEFLRNDNLDATPYFQPAGVPKPLFIQNQYGATFGGRVIRNRTFFFGSWQSSREVNAAPQTTTVPTVPQHSGTFTSKVTDPAAAGAPFPGNTIPMSRWDPVGAKLVALYPLPILGGTTSNYSYNPKERVSSDNYNVKMDHHFGKDFLFGRISQGWGNNILPAALPDPAQQTGHVDLKQRQVVVSDTHTFTPTLLNEGRVGFVYTLNSQDLDSPRLFDQFGIKGALDEPKIKGLPNFSISGFAGLGTIGPGSTPISASGSGNFPSTKSGKLWQINDSLTWIRNRHTLKTGVDLERATQFVYATNSARPTITFNGSYTGNGLGDVMLGYVYTSTTSQQQLDTIIQHIYNAFVQDDWKATSKLTLNLGVRYELPEPYFEAHDRQSNLILESGPCYLQLITVSQAGKCGLGRALVRADTNNFAPRAGFAYQVQPKMVIRGGAGFFYGRDDNIGIQRRLPANPPYVTAASFSGAGSTVPAYFLQAGLPANWQSLASGSTTINGFPMNFPVGYVEQWNINIQRDMGWNLVAQAGYTGSEAHKLSLLNNVNQALPGTTSLNSRRPYQGYGDIMYFSPQNNSTYNALIAKLERRYSKGFSFLASYTYGHSIDGGAANNDQSDPNPQDAHYLKGNKGSSNFDIRQRFVLSGFYQVPFGKGKGVGNLMARDWQVSGIFSRQTGQPLTVTESTDPSGTSTSARPNRIGDGNLPSDLRSRTHWFDTTAFVQQACVCFGNSGRSIIRAPGVLQLDFSVIRDFAFRERYRLQFRFESFNILNHPNLGLPNVAIGNQQVGIISSIVGNERQNQVALKFYF